MGSFVPGGASLGKRAPAHRRRPCAHHSSLRRHHPRPVSVTRCEIGSAPRSMEPLRKACRWVSHTVACAELTMAGASDAAIFVGVRECFKGTTGGIR